MSHLVEFLYFIAEVVGGLYQQQLSAISLPHNVKSRRVGRKKEEKKERGRCMKIIEMRRGRAAWGRGGVSGKQGEKLIRREEEKERCVIPKH